MVDRRGYEVISEEDYFNSVMADFKKQYPNMSENPANLLCILARIIARNENARDYDRVTSYSDAYVATATGQALSKAVRAAGISRLSGTRAIGKIVITKDPAVSQVIIPASMAVKSADNEYLTTNTSAIIMNTPTLEVEIASNGVGAIFNIGTNSKFNTVLNIRGITSIVSSGSIFGGTDVESDLALRNRYFSRMGAHSNSSLKGIMDAVMALQDTYLVAGDENNKDTTENNLLPHSFIIYVAGGADKDIAESIMQSKPAGVQTNGDVSVDVVVSGKSHPIKFSRFTDQTVYYRVEVAIDRTIAPPDFKEQLQDVIVNYTKVRSKIVSYEIINHISQEMKSVKGIKTMLFGLTQNPTTNTDITAPSGVNFVCERSNIVVDVI
ncbi:MAG: baseplate J/gp47 family protein [Paraclostridium sp.]